MSIVRTVNLNCALFSEVFWIFKLRTISKLFPSTKFYWNLTNFMRRFYFKIFWKHLAHRVGFLFTLTFELTYFKPIFSKKLMALESTHIFKLSSSRKVSHQGCLWNYYFVWTKISQMRMTNFVGTHKIRQYLLRAQKWKIYVDLRKITRQTPKVFQEWQIVKVNVGLQTKPIYQYFCKVWWQIITYCLSVLLQKTENGL